LNISRVLHTLDTVDTVVPDQVSPASKFSRIFSGALRRGGIAVPKRILSTSWDAAVLVTRNLIIKGAGYQVSTTREPEVFLRRLREEHFDAVVIGDSIQMKTRLDLARSVKALKPVVPLIVFSRTASEAQLLSVADYVIEALGPTEQFVTALRAAVGDEKAALGN
jgi:DNA-binding NtrC family response regulator